MKETLYGFTDPDVKRLRELLKAYESGSLTPQPTRGNPLIDRQLAKVRFLNNSGETIPAYGVMRITGSGTTTGGSWYLTVAKPSLAFQTHYLVNSGSTCADGAYSWGTFNWHGGKVLCDSTDAITYGHQWGPWPDSWALHKDRLGFHISGSHSSTVGLAEQKMITDVFIRLYESISYVAADTPDYAQAKVYMLYDSKWRDTQQFITAYDYYLNSGETIKAGTKAEATYYGSHWVIRNAYCDIADVAPAPAVVIGGGTGSYSDINAGATMAGYVDDSYNPYSPPSYYDTSFGN